MGIAFGNPVYLGIDFGRTNDPTVCWALEKVGDVFWTREVLVLKGVSTPDQEKILTSRIRRANRVCFDKTGPGVGLGDHLVKPELGFGEWKPEEHKFGKIELCTFTVEFKRRIFPKLRRAFEAPVKLRVPISRAVREDLHAMQTIIQKVLRYALLSRFVLIENTGASGHLFEVPHVTKMAECIAEHALIRPWPR